MLEKAGAELNPGKRKALYAEFQKILTEELPLVWTHELPYFTIYHKNLQGVPMSIRGLYTPWDKMWWKEGRAPK